MFLHLFFCLGMVTIKNETNIMVKNAIDIIFSGLSFWIVGFGLSFGVDEGTNAFAGIGYFITEVSIDQGEVYSMYFFQMALASTATTIVSGAMAERTNLKAYMLYSFVSTLSTCFPTHWIWGKNGFLRELGVIDIAGCSGVHLVGGAAGLAAAVMLGPRLGRFEDDKKRPQPCSMTNVLLGTFMLWWGWLGFNCGSTFGISGGKFVVMYLSQGWFVNFACTITKKEKNRLRSLTVCISIIDDTFINFYQLPSGWSNGPMKLVIANDSLP